MEVHWITTQMHPEALPALDNRAQLVIQVERKLEITIYGYGAGDYQLRVRALVPGQFPEDLQATLEAILGPQGCGLALVWASPRTIAWLVWEVLSGQ